MQEQVARHSALLGCQVVQIQKHSRLEMGNAVCLQPTFSVHHGMCTQYCPENRHKYYPQPPKKPHRNTVLTPEDYPSEAERQEIAAEKKRIEDEKKKAKLHTEGKDAYAADGSSKPKRRRLRKKEASPPPATTDEDRAHDAAI